MLTQTVAEVIQILIRALNFTYFCIDINQLCAIKAKNSNHTPCTLRYSYYI
jgi:hypothetical protein